MAGRDPIPGEADAYSETRDHARYHSRVVRGQVFDVQPAEGTIQVHSLEVTGARKATVPPLWFSAQGRQTAWGRYMPAKGDSVNVGYRNDDSMVVLGYSMETDDSGFGWKNLKGLEDAGNIAGYAVFKELKSLEFDFKSGGDAYIFGSNQGTLFLAGGQAFLRLDKNSYKIDSKAAAYLYSSETCTTRFGTVFRKAVPTDQAETPISMGIFKEFLVDVNQALPSGTPGVQSKAKLHFGDILDATNIPEISVDTGQPLRGRISIGDASNTQEVFKLEIDQLGNVVWNQGTLGVMGLKVRAQLFDIEAMLDARFNGLTITLGAIGANEPLVLGNKLVQSLTDFINNVIIANAASWGIGNLGAPVPLSPAVLSSASQWLAQNLVPTVGPFLSLKAFTEQGP